MSAPGRAPGRHRVLLAVAAPVRRGRARRSSTPTRERDLQPAAGRSGRTSGSTRRSAGRRSSSSSPGRSGRSSREVVGARRRRGASSSSFAGRSPRTGTSCPNTPIGASWRLTPADGSAAVTGGAHDDHLRGHRFDWRTLAGDSSGSTGTRGATRSRGAPSRSARTASGRRRTCWASRRPSRSTSSSTRPVGLLRRARARDARERRRRRPTPDIRTPVRAHRARARSTTPGWRIVIPHELTHLVFDTAVRQPVHGPPRWLNEGLAAYLVRGLPGLATAPRSRRPSPTARLMPAHGPRRPVPDEPRAVLPRLRRERVGGRLPGPPRTGATPSSPSSARTPTASPTTRRSGPRSAPTWPASRRPGWRRSGRQSPRQYGPQAGAAGPDPAWLAGPVSGRRDRHAQARRIAGASAAATAAPGSAVPGASPAPGGEAAGSSGPVFVIVLLLVVAGAVGFFALRRPPPSGRAAGLAVSRFAGRAPRAISTWQVDALRRAPRPGLPGRRAGPRRRRRACATRPRSGRRSSRRRSACRPSRTPSRSGSSSCGTGITDAERGSQGSSDAVRGLER